MTRLNGPITAVLIGLGAVTAGWAGLATGAVAVDTGIGRRTCPLGPRIVLIDAPRTLVFDLLAQPYRPGTAVTGIRVLERDGDMVLAAHTTTLKSGLKTTTIETVRLDRPERIDFHTVRGPVPVVVESFQLSDHDGRTRLLYAGRIGTDLWRPGQWWGRAVAKRWEDVVAGHLARIRDQAERATERSRRRHPPA
jgi:hypothetical protein